MLDVWPRKSLFLDTPDCPWMRCTRNPRFESCTGSKRALAFTGSRGIREMRTSSHSSTCVYVCSFLLTGLRSRKDIKMYGYTTTTIYHDTESARVVADEPRYHRRVGGERLQTWSWKSCAHNVARRRRHAPKRFPLITRTILTLLSILRSRFTITTFKH